jgi:serine/threonine protein kinase
MIVEENNSLELKLIDFNVSKKFRDEESYNKLLMRTNTGAAAFIAPELHKQEYYE